MESITQNRLCLHRQLEDQRQQNDALKSQLAHLQHLANIGTVSHMIAHEINNLLTPLRSYAALALENRDDRSLAEKALQRVLRNCERASKITESMLDLADGHTQPKTHVRIIGLVEEIFTCLCRDFAKDGITVQTSVPEDLAVWAVPVQIQQVVMNLILNAREAMLPRGGVLSVTATETADSVRIEVSDTGDGIEQADLQKIFETFFTTKTDRRSPDEYSGAGLGLAFCKMIVDEHGGSISVESIPTQGSKFRIALPKQQSGKS